MRINLFSLLLLVMPWSLTKAGTIRDSFNVEWGGEHVRLSPDGTSATVLLDELHGGGGLKSKKMYLYGKLSMQIQLIRGGSAQTIISFYMFRDSPHDEIDFEFLGQQAGHPYILQTNIFSDNIGGREQQIHLWFDPTAAFHTYTIVWNPVEISFYVDGVAIRQHINNAAIRPLKLPLEIHCSLWNGTWATPGVPIDWRLAPFIARYRAFDDRVSCLSGFPCPPSAWKAWGLSRAGRKQIKWVRSRFLVYDYCRDPSRFPGGLPPECRRGRV